MKYPNQKRINLGHLDDIKHEYGAKEPYLQNTKWEPLKEAMRNLTGNGFKLYLYLLSWEGQGYYDFSPSGIAKELHMSDEGARNARDELINKGYCVILTENSCEFYPISRTTVSSQKI